ncbi:MAG: hypothetical protein IGQ88_04265 [Gloeomargaritaceae cyanobacterium C42_A2020_066]|nr:hypothetical protein [Gloeomargaritaceae cyanobacterium C42_A2020_066]
MANAWWKRLDGWMTRRATAALERAYEAAQAIQALETHHFGGQRLSPDTEQQGGAYSYFKPKLDRYLLTLRLNLAQFRLSAPWVDAVAPPPDQKDNALGQLQLIETVLARYRPADFLDPDPPVVQPAPPREVPATAMDSDGAAFFAPSASLFGTVGEISRELRADYEAEVVRRLRFQRQQSRVALQFLLVLLTIPLLVQISMKNLVFGPLVNWYVERYPQQVVDFNQRMGLNPEFRTEALEEFSQLKEALEFMETLALPTGETGEGEARRPSEAWLQAKAQEIFHKYSTRSLDGLANLAADLCGLLTFIALAVNGRPRLRLLRQFIERVFQNLNDPTKVFILILATDLFVGFHSAEGWEVLLGGTARHFGLAENQAAIYTFIATVPVILDSLIKFWIFNYLTRSSPSAVAVLEKMNQ